MDGKGGGRGSGNGGGKSKMRSEARDEYEMQQLFGAFKGFGVFKGGPQDYSRTPCQHFVPEKITLSEFEASWGNPSKPEGTVAGLRARLGASQGVPWYTVRFALSIAPNWFGRWARLGVCPDG